MSDSSSSRPSTERWGPERRREFIDFRLQWDGRINRGELVEHFGISTQQASADLARYMEFAPHNLFYDKSAKVYRASDGFKPLVPTSDARQYLAQLTEMASGAAGSPANAIGWIPPHDAVHYPARPVQTTALLRLLRAMRDGEEVRVTYQSMRRPSATALWIVPHALGSDGLRWHVRAWSHEEGEFRDFVLSRIHAVTQWRRTEVDTAQDTLWFESIDVVIQPRDGLTPDQRRAVEMDYGMKKGRLVIRCRKALAWYVLRQLRLDQPETVSVMEQPIAYEDCGELRRLLAAARKQSSELRSLATDSPARQAR
ncbi:WYL domain-containing protein [Pelomonas sp. KK5]|uniref:WYL domain-containing protein n=1 Tax=Pelomonas sp. KK5 TaxID=1855730 RepID=UPI00097C5509|nr:WYL domain-containing protein [Pelomonas sp. KK5]